MSHSILFRLIEFFRYYIVSLSAHFISHLLSSFYLTPLTFPEHFTFPSSSFFSPPFFSLHCHLPSPQLYLLTNPLFAYLCLCLISLSFLSPFPIPFLCSLPSSVTCSTTPLLDAALRELNIGIKDTPNYAQGMYLRPPPFTPVKVQ